MQPPGANGLPSGLVLRGVIRDAEMRVYRVSGQALERTVAGESAHRFGLTRAGIPAETNGGFTLSLTRNSVEMLTMDAMPSMQGLRRRSSNRVHLVVVTTWRRCAYMHSGT